MQFKMKGQAFFYGLIGLVFALIFFGATSGSIQQMITAIAPSQSVTTQALLGIVLPGVVLAIVLGFWKTINPQGA